jgi:hypothetical protein
VPGARIAGTSAVRAAPVAELDGDEIGYLLERVAEITDQ